MPENWEFPEDPYYDFDFAAVKFAAVRGAERHICAISAPALNDQFRTEDTREAAMQNYREHSGWVQGIAIKLIEQGQPHPDGFYLITSEIARMLGRLA